MTDKLPWLGLRSIPGVGLVLMQRLIQRYGGPAAVFQAAFRDLVAIKGISPAIAQAILGFRDWDKLEAQLARLTACGAEMVTQDDPRFPARLKEIPYPPPFLFIKGTLEAGHLAVAMVGTRGASYYGLKACRRLAGALAARGVTVVSGLARGIDTAAHQGALEMGGRTLAVLGCGLDVIYPPENRKLYQEIPEHGALVSEFPLGAPPEARNFPIRNRIISGLAAGVVVVEAGTTSGTAITVRYALDQGREVFAVPGPIDSPTSTGPHRLIQEGAKLVQDVEDILQELPGAVKGPGPLFSPAAPVSRVVEAPSADRPAPEDPLLSRLGSEPMQLEELVRISRLPAQDVMTRLTLLELQGLVKELPGKCYVLGG
ncbi:MAG: DNA-processing protein DprA [Syntrophobacterales bacterium]|jgi:DNA processing protein|nr:DNA-processing protein DprA [Syntrophobacterales bacterium]